MKKATDQSNNTKFSLTQYRKSILSFDCLYGSIITAIGFAIFLLFGLSNTLLSISIVGYLVLSAILYIFIRREKYIFEAYLNLIGSILLIVTPTLLYGNNLHIQFFLLSLSLSSFIYTNNKKFNQIFFVIHLVIFAILSLVNINPIYHLTPELQTIAKSTALVLFTISFIYKMLFVHSIYIENYELVDKNHLIYQTLFDNSYDGIVTSICNKFTKQLTENKNKKVLSFFDALDDEFSIEEIQDFFPLKQPNGELSTDYFVEECQVLKEGKTGFFKFTFKKKNGDLFDALITAIKIQEIFEDITVYLFKDITEEAKNKRLIKYQMEELHVKNLRLQKYIDNQLQFENFAHLAAHDLKSPIRTLVSFSQILQESTVDKISDEEKEYIQFIKKSANKVGKLIADLSNFAELYTETFTFKIIDFDILKTDIYKQLKASFSNVDYYVSYQNLPNNILANAKYLPVLFFETISNAIQYKKPNEQSIVNVKCIEKKGFYQFDISDNGIGIKKEEEAAIFTIFKKSINNTNVDNTGIGLATCAKIVEMHNGKIWLTSTIGKGSTFSFTISKSLNTTYTVSKTLPLQQFK